MKISWDSCITLANIILTCGIGIGTRGQTLNLDKLEITKIRYTTTTTTTSTTTTTIRTIRKQTATPKTTTPGTSCASEHDFHCGSEQKCIDSLFMCNSKQDCADGSDENEINCPDGPFPNELIQGSNISLINVDENVGMYSEGDSCENLTWLFRFLSKAWKYVKGTYGIIGDSPLLYLFLNRHRSYLCDQRSSLENPGGYRNLIACRKGDPQSQETRLGDSATLKMLFSLGVVTARGANGIINNMDVHICGSKMSEIIFYDIYIHLKGKSADVLLWRSENLKDDIENNFCFRDWYLPIYEHYGGAQALNKFYDLSKSYYFRNLTYNSMNLGEFAHFWSEAAGHNLQPLASSTFRWNDTSDQELSTARESYVFEDNIAQSLVYSDNNVGLYFKNYPIHQNSTYATISKAWKYVNENYSPPRLNESSTASHRISVRHFTGNTIITATAFNFQENVIEEIGRIALSGTQFPGPESWPAFTVSGLTIAPILIYDILSGLKMTDEAERWDRKIKKADALSRPDAFWFRDWYYTIYFKHGRTSVLKGFLSLLRNRTNAQLQINLGEFVHFWSIAAKTDLHGLAKQYLDWNEEHLVEFVRARQENPSEYTCINCDQLPEVPLPTSPGFLEANQTTIGIGAAIFAVVLLVLILGLKIYADRRKIQNLNQHIRSLTNEEVYEFYQGNPNLAGNDTHAPIQSMPFNTQYEIPRERLIIDDKKVLGSGKFGLVKQGLLKGDLNSDTEDTTVAVKMVKPHVEVAYFLAHLSEIKIMAYLGQHANIASLLATVTNNIRNREVFVVMEFCPERDLLRYLKENGKNFVNLFCTRNAVENHVNPMCLYTNAPDAVVRIEPSCGGSSSDDRSNQESSAISTLNLVQWSKQIANGMTYLNEKKVIHGDLAARNVLLDANKVAKISDFGLSRQLVNYSNYLKKSQTPLPWRWLAIESLENMIFSPLSDIWAFGVTLWEIFTLGKVPYPGKTWNQDFVDGLVTGERLALPKFGNQEIYALMMNCMKTAPQERIPFSEIISQLEVIEASLPVE